MLDFLVENTQEEETMADERKRTPQEKYDAENTKRFGLKLNLKYDEDIIQKLESVESKQTYIKSLIRADLAKTSDQKKTRAEIIERLRAIERALDGLDI